MFGKSTEIYKFEKIKRAKKAARLEKPDVALIDMGVGEPDEMAFPEVVQALQEAATDPNNRGYADNGSDSFKESAIKYMNEVFGIDNLNAETDVVHSIGSKSALSLIPLCFVNEDDYVLMTTPGYPIFGTHSQYVGGKVYNLPLKEENQFFARFACHSSRCAQKGQSFADQLSQQPNWRFCHHRVF